MDPTRRDACLELGQGGRRSLPLNPLIAMTGRWSPAGTQQPSVRTQPLGTQLATQRPVLAIGGFNGSDPAPTLAEFQARVGAGEIHYFVSGGQGLGGGQMGGSRSASEIAAWVAQSFAASTVDSVTLYDLTAPTAAGSGGAAGQEA